MAIPVLYCGKEGGRNTFGRMKAPTGKASMVKSKLIAIFILLQFLFFTPAAHAEYESIYHYYIEEGVEAFYKGDFENAIFYFKTAHAIDPDRQQPIQFLNLIKREQEGRSKNTQTPTENLRPEICAQIVAAAVREINDRTPAGEPQESVIFQAIENAATEVKKDLEKDIPESEWSQIVSRATADTLVKINSQTAPLESDVVKTEILPLTITPHETTIIKKHSAKKVLASKKTVSKQPKSQKLSSPIAPYKSRGSMMPQTERSFTVVEPHNRLRHLANGEEVLMNDGLWTQQQTAFTIEMEIGKSAIFTGKNIAKYLATNLDIISIARIDSNRISVTAARRGTTILYVWDDKGRWTFNIRCEYPFVLSDDNKKSLDDEQSSPFRMGYSNSWTTYYKGPDVSGLRRQSLTFTNWLGISGETPHGFFDASANTNMFPNSTEIVGQRIGLSNGQIGPFKDFTLRGYDVYKELSDLTMPGRYFRGALIDAYAFQHKIAYSYFRGQDQSITLYSSSTTFTRQNSYIEGFKLVLNPDEPGKYAFNYAHGYGTARPREYKSEVYSLETKQKIKGGDMHGEMGYDRDVFSEMADWHLDRKELTMNFSLKNIEKGYQTVYGQPSGAGLLSGSWSMGLNKTAYQFNSFVDLYRDRVLPNPDNPDLVNFDISTSISKPLSETSSIGAGLSYTYTPQVISPRSFAQESTNYNKNYKLGARYLSLSLGQTLQWSRNENSPSADYDRLSLRAGFRMQLIQYLYFSTSYDYIWVREVLRDTISMPSAINTSLSYNIPLTDHLFFGTDVNYRKEQQSKSSFTFLAGEDSLSNTLSLTYKPSPDMEIFMDSQLRHVWSHHNSTNPDYVDWNSTVGMRAEWNLPFHWNPTGEIRGIVYKDYNGNSLQDKDEPGLANIKVLAGKYETTTNENGEYSLKVQAKKSTVSLDLKSIPKGFVFSTALSRKIIIEHHKPVNVNFGLTSRSGIYGIAYFDLNGSGKPDRGDKFMPNVVVRLDGTEITKTDHSGSYFFENISPGKHKIRIDVNSINILYFPAIKIESEVEVQEGMTYIHNILLTENPGAKK